MWVGRVNCRRPGTATPCARTSRTWWTCCWGGPWSPRSRTPPGARCTQPLQGHATRGLKTLFNSLCSLPMAWQRKEISSSLSCRAITDVLHSIPALAACVKRTTLASCSSIVHVSEGVLWP